MILMMKMEVEEGKREEGGNVRRERVKRITNLMMDYLLNRGERSFPRQLFLPAMTPTLMEPRNSELMSKLEVNSPT